MTRRGALLLALMPGVIQQWSTGSLFVAQPRENNWSIALPDKLTVTTKDGWSKTFTHDELKRMLTEEK